MTPKVVIFTDRPNILAKHVIEILSMFNEVEDRQYENDENAILEKNQLWHLNNSGQLIGEYTLEDIANDLMNEDFRIVPYSDFQHKYRYRKGDFCWHHGLVRDSKVEITGMEIDMGRDLVYIVKRCSDGECYSSKPSSLMKMTDIIKADEHTLTGKRYFIPGNIGIDNLCYILTSLGVKGLQQEFDESLFYCINSEGRAVGYTKQEIEGHVKAIITDLDGIVFPHGKRLTGGRYISSWIDSEENEDKIMLKLLDKSVDGINRIIMFELL